MTIRWAVGSPRVKGDSGLLPAPPPGCSHEGRCSGDADSHNRTPRAPGPVLPALHLIYPRLPAGRICFLRSTQRKAQRQGKFPSFAALFESGLQKADAGKMPAVNILEISNEGFLAAASGACFYRCEKQ